MEIRVPRALFLSMALACGGAPTSTITPTTTTEGGGESASQPDTLSTETSETGMEARTVVSTQERVITPAMMAAIRDPEQLMRAARFIPFEEANVLVGVELEGIRRGTMLSKLGLENGDVVLSIAGHPLSSAQDTLAGFAAARQASQFDVQVRRAERTFTIRYRVE